MASDPVSGFVDFLTQYWYYIVIVFGAMLIIYMWDRGRDKSPKPVERGEVERRNFIKRMAANDSYFTTVKQNKKDKYKILKLQISAKKDGEKEYKFYEMVLQPLIVGLVPLGRAECYVLNGDSLDWDGSEPYTIIFKDNTSLWLRNGIYVDNSFSKGLTGYFNREYSAQTDLEGLSSEYYAMAQENSVIQPDRGHATLSEHLNIERIKEERKKQQLGG